MKTKEYRETVSDSKAGASIRRKCKRSTATVEGGQRRRFVGETKKEAIVRKVAKDQSARLKCDIDSTGNGVREGSQNVLCDTGAEAGCCGKRFAEKNKLEVDEECDIVPVSYTHLTLPTKA